MIGRVQDRRTFAAMRTHGVRAGSGPLTITYVTDENTPWVGGGQVPLARVAFGVSRRIGNAVERNRLRRRLRAILGEAPEGRVPPGAYLLTARPGAAQLSYPELRDHVHRALNDTVRRAASRSQVAHPHGSRQGSAPRASR